MRFQRAGYDRATTERMRGLAEGAGVPFGDVMPDRVYISDGYQVGVWDRHRNLPPGLIWLSIKRRDRQPIHDYRELMAIKDAIVGPSHEAVELYPARDREVDTSNQYHLFVLADPKARFPFGWTEGCVSGPEEAEPLGACQRPFEESSPCPSDASASPAPTQAAPSTAAGP